MIYDAFTLAACVREMQAVLPGMIVHQVRQPHELTTVLVCRTPGRQAEVTLSAHPRYARAHLSTVREPLPQKPPGFCQLLRKHLEGMRIGTIEQEGLDRILTISFQSADGMQVSLVHEIMGRHSNTILVSPERKILGAIKYVPARLSRVRQILPGRDYDIPPANRRDPRAVSQAEFADMWAQDLSQDDQLEKEKAKKWLISTFEGMSPALAAETLARAGQAEASAVFRSLKELLTVFETRTFHAVVIHYSDRPYEEVYPIHLSYLPTQIQHPRSTLSEPLEATVRAEMAGAALESAREELLRFIQKSRQRLAHDVEDLQDILAHPEEGQKLRQTADILAGSYHMILPAKDSVRLPDYYDPEMGEIDIPLRSDLTANDNIQRYYKLAKKAEDRYLAAEQRLPQMLADTQRLLDVEENVRQAESLESIRDQREALLSARLIQQTQQTVPTDREERPFEGHRIRCVVSSDGLEILYGETAEANDYLTTRVARPGDIWMHARSVTGAHVVIRMSGVKQVPAATLREAADTAARHSDARHSSYIPVDWTLRKYVRKSRRSAPGAVTYTHEKTLHVTR
ncbi:MAG: NFACT family protein [Armatimonadetes bacterium]|nr:NFACT family protein [Armatimonadota bacterium]